jgi:hypothetical protein
MTRPESEKYHWIRICNRTNFDPTQWKKDSLIFFLRSSKASRSHLIGSCFSMIKIEKGPWRLLETGLIEGEDPLTFDRYFL